MNSKTYWYDGMMDADDIPAIELLVKNKESKLAGLSICFKDTEPNTEIQSKIEGMTSQKIIQGALRPIIAHKSIVNENALRDFDFEPENCYAWDTIYAAAKKCGGLTLLCAGTLTNIALAILRYADFAEYIDRIIFIAGTQGIGDCAAMSENKACLDVYALKTVLMSGVRLLYIGKEAWSADRVLPIDLVKCALEIDSLELQSANMDVETARSDQFARTIIDTRANSKAEKNIEFVFL